ncbi:Zn-dependent protease [Legionella feeleii]|uniref:Zn-dependent protease n=1 Tax=Legionella feeleii TaxID=453 RepID=A0A378J326_9GAMM|nr:Zn-dependent protease [Legionella feeleii]
MNLLRLFKRQGFSSGFMRGCLCFFLVFIQLLPTTGLAFSPYSTRELEELEKEFIQLINQSDSIERDALANQYINHLGKKTGTLSPYAYALFFYC